MLLSTPVVSLSVSSDERSVSESSVELAEAVLDGAGCNFSNIFVNSCSFDGSRSESSPSPEAEWHVQKRAAHSKIAGMFDMLILVVIQEKPN